MNGLLLSASFALHYLRNYFPWKAVLRWLVIVGVFTAGIVLAASALNTSRQQACVVKATQAVVGSSGMAAFKPVVTECLWVSLKGVKDGGGFICAISMVHPQTGETRTVMNPGVEENCLE